MESATLPSRLKVTPERSRTTLDDIEDVFTTEARRNILQLALTAKDPNEEVEKNGLNGDGTQLHDSRMVNGVADHDDETREPKDLDVDFFRACPPDSGRGSPTHTIARMDFMRGSWNLEQRALGREETHRRTGLHRRHTIIQQYTSHLLLPLPSSYPPVFRFPSHRSTEEIAVHAALSSSTAVAGRMRYLADIVRRSVAVEERESLTADLLTSAEEYIEGWEYGSSEDDD